jgi:hypothetical protein
VPSTSATARVALGQVVATPTPDGPESGGYAAIVRSSSAPEGLDEAESDDTAGTQSVEAARIPAAALRLGTPAGRVVCG